MKMPRRPFYPAINQLLDIFGLHRPSLLGRALESEEDKQQRVAKVAKGVEDAFNAAVGHLGEEEARQLFRRVNRKPKRGLGKTLAADRDVRCFRNTMPRFRPEKAWRRSLDVCALEVGSWVTPRVRSRPRFENW
jgi:hypothetical protein